MGSWDGVGEEVELAAEGDVRADWAMAMGLNAVAIRRIANAVGVMRFKRSSEVFIAIHQRG
jgi:hypothetical protein